MAKLYRTVYIDDIEMKCKEFEIKTCNDFLSKDWQQRSNDGKPNTRINIRLLDDTRISFEPDALEEDTNGNMHVYGFFSRFMPDIFTLEPWKRAYIEYYYPKQRIKIYQIKNDSTLFNSDLATVFKEGFIRGNNANVRK